MSELSFRAMREADRDEVLAFCEQTWSWGDYIHLRWDDWVHDQTGRFLLAELQGKPVGLVKVTKLTDDEIWLEGIRVHPEIRRQGIGARLNDAALEVGREQGAILARLYTHDENVQSQRLVESKGFRQVGITRMYSADAFPKQEAAAPEIRLATAKDRAAIVDYLRVSNIFPLVGATYQVNWKAYALTDDLLDQLIERQQVILLERWHRLDGLMMVERSEVDPEFLEVGYLDGLTIEAISLLAYEARRRIPELGCQKVRVYASEQLLIGDALPGLDYTYDNERFYIYEKNL